MKAYLTLGLMAIISLAFAAESAFATVGHPSTPLPLLVEQRLNQSGNAAPISKLGTQVTQKKVNVLKAVYDFAVLGGASGASIILKDASGGDATLPKNALVKNVMVRVVTAFTVTDAATIKCGWDSASSNLLASGTATTLNAGNRMTAGAIVAGTVSGWRRVDDYNHAIGCVIGVGTVTAGKMVLYIEYYIGAPNE